uniref:Uncharacterized protein n=1 Tax=Oryza meridionalis TaxID=40149 RepID=A0A0E0F4T1_9ORYZ
MAEAIEGAPVAAPQLPCPPLLLDLATGKEATGGDNNKGADGGCFHTPLPLSNPGGGEAGHG